MFGRIKHIHFVGIGGIGMSGIAELLLNLGFKVSGSDLTLSEITENLTKKGAKIKSGHSPENVNSVDALVYSSAVRPDNPEIQAARARKIPIIRRAEMLAEIVRLKPYGIAVAGTHGKTTTTSMIGAILREGGFDPTIIVGGVLKSLSTNAQLGEGDYIIVEADEFDRSFLRLSPTMAVITTIESEHLDCYQNLDEIKKAFVEFANKVPFYGSVIACSDEKGVKSILPDVNKKIITYGVRSQSQFMASGIHQQSGNTSYTLMVEGKRVGEIDLKLPGVHNVKNSLAAVGIGYELQIPFKLIKKALGGFTGIRRRFEIKGEIDGILIVDDYAHHPTEIECSLKAAKEGWNRRIIAVFQPHLYTRTRDFHNDFGKSFSQSDILIVTDIYPAREQPIPGITGKLVADAARKYGHSQVHYIKNKNEIGEFLIQIVRSNDMVITIGAGDVWKICNEIWEKLSAAVKKSHG